MLLLWVSKCGYELGCSVNEVALSKQVWARLLFVCCYTLGGQGGLGCSVYAAALTSERVGLVSLCMLL